MFPCFQIGGSVFGEYSYTILFSGYDHVIFATFALEDEGVAEVFPAVTVIATEQEESTIFVPRLEIGRSGPHHNFSVSCVSGIIGIIYFIGFIIEYTTST